MVRKLNLSSIIIMGIVIVFAIGIFSRISQKVSPTITINGHVLQMEIANTPEKQTQGLSGRETMGELEGMLFIFPDRGERHFWMKDMKFPIDIIWIGGDKVVGFVENAPTPSEGENLKVYSSPGDVDKVLEVNAGLVKKWGIRIGDRISLDNI